jgi:homopolymeric O-antigen transport system permease protein
MRRSDMPGAEPTRARIVIEAGRTERYYWRDFWRYRELLYFLARRDLAVRYKQTFFGVAWALVRPLLTMLIFTLVFGRLAKLPSEGAPYSLLVLSGMLPWFLFSSVLADASDSLVSNNSLVSKVYFPRLIMPASAAVVAVVDFAIGIVLLIAMMAVQGYPPALTLFTLPIFVALALGIALGLGLWCAAMNVRYRDFRFVIPFALMAGLYLSPIGFSSSVIPESWRLIYSINPMVGVIEGFRWAVLGEAFKPHLDALVLSAVMATTLLLSGIWYFRRVERSFADVI